MIMCHTKRRGGGFALVATVGVVGVGLAATGVQAAVVSGALASALVSLVLWAGCLAGGATVLGLLARWWWGPQRRVLRPAESDAGGFLAEPVEDEPEALEGAPAEPPAVEAPALLRVECARISPDELTADRRTPRSTTRRG